jgi:hypothetical protein
MSEYEGKIPYRNYSRNVDINDILYYEATGNIMSREDKEKIDKIMEFNNHGNNHGNNYKNHREKTK